MARLPHGAALMRRCHSEPPKSARGSVARLTFTCLLATACLTLASCANLKVKLPKSDSTPPSLVWTVFSYDTNTQTDHPGSPTIQAKLGDSYRVTLEARDPQGVKSIQINPTVGSGEISWSCSDPPGPPPLQQSKHALLGPMTQNLSADSSGYVLTSIFLIQDLDLGLSCQVGWTFGGGTATLTGQASNYFGGVTTEVIEFVVAP